MKVKTFKQLVIDVAKAKTAEDLDNICCDVMRSFNTQKISWKDHEIIYALISIHKSSPYHVGVDWNTINK